MQMRATGARAEMGAAEKAPTRSLPLHLWLASLLRDSIEAGHLGPGARVPSERTLSLHYGVSRMTCRQALETLALEGYIYRDARRGTFVAQPRLRFSVGSFTRIMVDSDHVPGCEVLAASTVLPDTAIAEMLGVPPGGRVHLIQRLRSVKGEPIAIENIHVSAERFPDLLGFDLTGSLWDLLRSRYGVYPTKADARLLAVTLDRFEAETMRARAGTSALALSRTIYGSQGEVIELARDVYRGDRAEFYVSAPVDEIPPPSLPH